MMRTIPKACGTERWRCTVRVLIINTDVQSKLEQKGQWRNLLQRLGLVRPWMPPLGILELATMVRQSGVAIEGIRCWDEIAQGVVPDRILTWSDVVMISGLTPSRYRAGQLAYAARAAGKIVIGGGRDVSGQYMEGKERELLVTFDAICIGVCSTSLMAEILHDVSAGIVKGKVYQLPPGTPVEPVIPERGLLVKVKYFAPESIRSSGGCNNGCEFCTVTEKWTPKPLPMLEEELRYLLAIGCRFFLDTSDNFLGDLEHALEVIRRYRSSGIHWGTEASVRRLLTERDGKTMIEHMAAAGCRLIYVGVESIHLHQAKGSKEDAERLILLARRLGVVVIGALILDLNGDETEDDVRANVVWAAEWLDFAQFSLVALLSGSILRQHALRDDPSLIEDDNPEHYDGSHPTMRHTMSAEERLRLFYWAYRHFGRVDLVLRRVRRAPRGWKLLVLAGGIRYAIGRPHRQ